MNIMRQAPVPGRFGHACAAIRSRKQQRKLEQAAGLQAAAIGVGVPGLRIDRIFPGVLRCQDRASATLVNSLSQDAAADLGIANMKKNS